MQERLYKIVLKFMRHLLIIIRLLPWPHSTAHGRRLSSSNLEFDLGMRFRHFLNCSSGSQLNKYSFYPTIYQKNISDLKYVSKLTTHKRNIYCLPLNPINRNFMTIFVPSNFQNFRKISQNGNDKRGSERCG